MCVDHVDNRARFDNRRAKKKPSKSVKTRPKPRSSALDRRARQGGEFENYLAQDDGPIAHRLRNKHCLCPKVKRDCQIIVDNIEVLRRKISMKDCSATGALRFYLRSTQSVLRHLNALVSNGGHELDFYDLSIAKHFFLTKKACKAQKHKWWTLKRKNKK